MKLQRAFFVVIALAFVVSLGSLFTGGNNQKAQVVAGTNSIGLVAPISGTTISVGQTLPMTCQVEVAPGYGLSRLKFSWFQNNGAEVGDFVDNQYSSYLSSGNFTENVTIPNITPGSNFKLQCVGYYKDLSNPSIPAISKTQSLPMNFVTTPAVIYGCTDPTATNYNSNATQNDGSCTYPVADTVAPSTPTNFSLSLATSSSLRLTWTASTDNVGVVKYEIYRNNGGATSVNTTTPFAIVNAPVTTYINSGLLSGKTYRYNVKAVDAAGNKSALSTRVAATTLSVAAPTSVTVTSPTTNSLTLNWSPSSSVNVFDYVIYANAGGSTSIDTNTPIGTVLAGTHTFTHQNLISGTVYKYRLRARDDANNASSLTSQVSGTTATATITAPSVPSGLSTTATQNSITVTWGASTGAAGQTIGYKIFRSTSATGSFSQLNSTLQTALSYTNSSLSSNVTYYYKVQACYTAITTNCSAQSSVISETTAAPADTTVPTATITAPTASQVLPAGTTSTTLSVTTNEVATCKWNTTDVAYTSMANTFSGAGSTSHTATLTGLVNGTTYTRYVRCQDTAGNMMTTSVSRTFSVAAPIDTTAPAVPTLSVGAVTSTTIALSWSAVTDPSSPVTYKIYRNGTYIGSPISGTSTTDLDLVEGTLYSYTISACDSAPTQNCSNQSAPVTVTTTAIPTIVSSLQVVQTNGTVVSTLASGQQLNVGSQANATYAPLSGAFSIKANPGNPAPTSIKFDLTGPSGFTAYTQCESSSPYALFGDSGATALTSWPTATQILGAYTLTVTPYSAATCTGAAGTPVVNQFILANFDDLTPPTNPTGAASTYRSVSEIRLSWAASTDAGGVSHYNVTRNPGTMVNVGNQTTFVDTNVTSTGTYSYTITAVDNVGNTSGVSNAVSSPTLSTSFASGNQVETNTTTSIKVTPDASGNAGNQVAGTVGVITNSSAGPINPVWTTGGINYWYVDFASGIDGWVNENNLDSYIPPPTDTTPPTANITAPTPNQILPVGTTSFTMTVTTNEAATCKWSVNDVSYGSMTETFNGFGTTSHNYPLLGLTDGSNYTRYVRCQDSIGNPMTSSESITFSVATVPPPAGDPAVNTTCPATMPVLENDARNAARLSVQLCAQVSESTTPKTITLKWASVSGRTVSSITVYRKTETGSWANVATPAASSTSWTDANISVGTYYEYKVEMVTSSGTVYGYIASGIKVPQEAYRGRLILVIDNSKANGLNGSTPTSGAMLTQVNQLISDLNADKWVVTPVYVSSTATPASVRTLIKGYYDTDANDGNSTTNTKAVYLFGHVPAPIIGNLNPDGHGGRGISSDQLYAEMTATWNTGTVGSSAGYGVSGSFTMPSTHTYNNPSPNASELQVGRVDMYDLPGMPGTENEKLSNYLTKAANFKKRSYIPTDTMYLRARTPYTATGISGWSSIASNIGPQNVTHDRTASDLWMNLGQNHLFVLGYGQSGGVLAVDKIPQPGLCISGCGSNNLTSVSWGGVFNVLSSSYVVEWNDTNSILRAILADDGKSLTMAYGLDNHWYLHHMGMGKTIGYSSLASINNATGNYDPRGVTGNWDTAALGSNSHGHMTLLGDPTLRSHYVGMPTGTLSMTNSGGMAAFSWGASSDSPLGYNIYEIQSNQIRKVNTNIISGTSFTSGDAYDANKKYMVTAVKVRAGNSGTYYNESLGLIGAGGGGLLSDIDNPAWSGGTSNLTVGSATTTSLTVSWNSATDATIPVTYKLQRRLSPSGTYAEVYSGSATSFSNTGLTTGTAYDYQVRACDGVGIPNCTAWSSAVSGTTLSNDTIAPTIPGTPTVAGTTSASISLSWTASTDAVGVTGYKIFRSSSSGGTYTEVGTSATNSYTNTGLSSSTTYYYKVSAYDAANNNSAQSGASSGIATQAAQSGGQTVSGINGPVGPSLTTNATSCTNPSGGTIYYVDAVAGNDANNGTSVLTAWKSVAKVTSLEFGMSTGTMICFKRGQTHYGNLKILKSGTASAPIIVDAYGTGTAPIISGNILLTGWTQHSGNIWKTTLSSAPASTPKYLFVGSAYQTLARQPNTGWYYTESRGANSMTDTDNSWLSSQSANSLVGAVGVYRASPWSFGTMRVTGNSGATMNVERYDHINSGAAIQYGLTWSNLKWGYILRNKLAFLDTQGEWFFDSSTNTVYLWAPGSANPNSLTVELSSQPEALYLNTSNNVKVRNLIIEGATSYAVRLSNNRGVALENLEIRNSNIGIHQYGTSTLSTVPNFFANNYVHDLNAAGISSISPGAGEIIEGNVVERISVVEDRIFTSDMTHVGIIQPSNNGIVRRNIVRDTGYAGIAGSGSGLITENLVERSMATLTDGSGITFDATNGLTISKNIIKDIGVGSGQNAGSTAGPGAQPNMVSMPILYVGYSAKDKGIYWGNGSVGIPNKNTTIDGNIVVNTTDGIWIDHSRNTSGDMTSGNKAINNTVFDFNRSGIGFTNYSLQNTSQTCEPAANSPCFINFDNVVTGNKLYGINTYQNPLFLLHSWSNGAGAVVDWGTINNNYYYNPFRTAKIWEVRNFGTGENQWTLAEWRANRNEDTNSTSSTYTLTNTNQSADIFYNATGSPITQSVNGCNANGTPLTGTQTIQPFTAIVVEYGNC